MRSIIRRPAFVAGVIAAALSATSGLGVAAQDAETAMLRVLHASPDAPAVDVYADGARVLAGVGFGAISDYLEVPAGDHQIQVFAADADPAAGGAVIDATVTLPPGSMTTVAATNALESIEAQVITDDPAPTADGAQVRVAHLSADTPPIDIAPAGGEEIIQALAYPSVTEYLPVPAGELDVEVRPAGAVDGWVAFDPGGVLLSDAHSYTLFAIGSLEEGSVRLLTAVDATLEVPTTAMVRVLHASPDAPAVDVHVDGTAVLTGVAFGTISEYLEVPAGDHLIQVFGAGADPAAGGAVLEATLTFAGGTMTTVAATNALADIEAQVITDDPEPTADGAQLRIVHLAADAPAVTIAPDATPRKPIVKRLAYPTATAYISINAGPLDVQVQVAGKPRQVALDLDPLTLEAGTSVSAFAIGSVEGGSLTVVTAVDATVP